MGRNTYSFGNIVFEIHKLSNRNCMFDTKKLITFESKYESILKNILQSNLRSGAVDDLCVKLFAIKANSSDILYNKLVNIEKKLLDERAN